MPETHGLPRNLVHVPLKDSPLSDYGGFFGDSDIQVNLEESGVFSDLCVVKGTEIGVSIVSVSLLESSSRYLKDEITLTVAEAMSLDPPSPVYVLIGAVVRYTLKSIRSNMPRVVSLPSPFHHWSASNSSVAEVDGETGTARALSLGATQVVVRDTRILGQMQISSLHIVLPDNLLLFLRPLYLCGDCNIPAASRWYLVAGQRYIIHLKALSSTETGTHEVFITANNEIVIDLAHWGQFFCDILPVSVRVANKNKYRILIAYSSGSGKLIATLAYRTGHGIKKEVLKVSQEFTVCDQVEFVKERAGNRFNRILLPWVPGVYQEFQLKASGGCAVFPSHYKWLSLDEAVVSVSASGIVRARKPGNATIRVVSIFDSLNYDEMVIEVSVPSSMIILPIFPVEVPVGSHLQASLTLRASSGALNSSSSSYGPACVSTLIYPSGPGRTIVHATLNRENRHSESYVLNVSLRVAAYSPLTIHQASDGNRFGGYWFDTARIGSWNELGRSDDVNLALGTYLDVMLSGGPERWGDDVEFVETVDVIDEGNTYAKSRIFLDRISTVYGNLYRIGCKSLEPFSVIFRRGNLMGEEHRFPAVSEAEMVLTCSYPSYIVIIPDEELNALPVIWSARGAERTATVANGREIRISAVGISNFDIAFANSSSFTLRWELSGCEGLATFDDSKGYSSWERFLKLQNTSGRCTVRSTIVGFNDSLSNPDLSMLLGSYVDLTAAIQLQLVSPIRVSPEFSLLFFSPVARLNISIIGGSCYFDGLVNDTEIVEVVQQPTHGCDDCSQLTLAPKGVGSALVTVGDIGLIHTLSASSTVRVAEMDWIKILTGGGRIRIMEGSFESVNLSVGVVDGRVFDPSQYIYMGIRVHIEENIVEVVDDYDFSILPERCVRGQKLVLQATRVGVTTIYLSATKRSGRKILSQPVMLEVYSPPRLHASDILLVPGS
ncbi:PREDICTED: nuclear pore complex protein GP210-like [Erythranthe guttata]|uniref:nuclear pore complex protein GP210-like n=1 Tax=Erythranthe guttata TaxID=4155 RepID=UPI00064DCE3F|nr:PREDICTED: nuclear pore complex protein GP210-like [Erythranthe guttata]|eukprot:XP_012837561.1 PREDICTED: nuclear pore complex protein GP210-like [Erythranthe guttata]